MSQQPPPYPSPYQPPQFGPPPALPYGTSGSGAARKAGILLYVLGGLSILMATCCGVMGAVVEQMAARQPEVMATMPPEATPQMLRVLLLAGAGLAVVFGIAQIVLARFVGRGSRGAIITAIVLSVLALLFFGVQMLGGLLQGAMAGVCVPVVPVALYVLLIVWLVQALRDPAPAGPWPAAPGPQAYPPGYLEAWQQHQRAYEEWSHQQQQQQQPPSPPPADDRGTRGPTDRGPGQ